LKGLLPRQGFRRDGKLFALPAETAKHADAQGYGAFVQQLQAHSVTKFAEIFRANAKNNVNLRAAGNAMLVLNKIKTVRLLSQLVPPAKELSARHLSSSIGACTIIRNELQFLLQQ
jgi:hypothetical protein